MQPSPSAPEPFTADDLQALITACRMVKKYAPDLLPADYHAADDAWVSRSQTATEFLLLVGYTIHSLSRGAQYLQKREAAIVRDIKMDIVSCGDFYAWEIEKAALKSLLYPPEICMVFTESAAATSAAQQTVEELDWFKNVRQHLWPVLEKLWPKIKRLHEDELLDAATELTARQKETGDLFEGKPYYFADRVKSAASQLLSDAFPADGAAAAGYRR